MQLTERTFQGYRGDMFFFVPSQLSSAIPTASLCAFTAASYSVSMVSAVCDITFSWFTYDTFSLRSANGSRSKSRIAPDNADHAYCTTSVRKIVLQKDDPNEVQVIKKTSGTILPEITFHIIMYLQNCIHQTKHPSVPFLVMPSTY